MPVVASGYIFVRTVSAGSEAGWGGTTCGLGYALVLGLGHQMLVSAIQKHMYVRAGNRS